MLYSLRAKDKQEGLTFNVIHQLLVYADVVDFLSANIGCCFAGCAGSKYREKVQRRQLGGQIDNIKVADKFLEACGKDQRFGNDTNKSELRGRRGL